MKDLPYILLIFAAGVCWPLQAAVNAELKTRTGQPLVAVLVNGGGAAVIAGLAMVVLGLAARQIHTPTADQVSSTPWWAYLGGVISVLVIAAQSSSAGPLGAALMITVLVAGQGVSSLVFDGFGLLGYDHRPVTATRLAGVLCVLLGAGLLAFGGRSNAPPTSDDPEAVQSPTGQ